MEAIKTVDPYEENLNDLRGYYDDLSYEYESLVDDYNVLSLDYHELELEYETLQEEYDSLQKTNYNTENDLNDSTSILVFLIIILFFAWLYEKGKNK